METTYDNDAREEEKVDTATPGPDDFAQRRDAAIETHIKEKLARGDTSFSDDECQFLARHFGLEDHQTPFGTQFTEETSPTKGSDLVEVAKERLARAEESGDDKEVEKARATLRREEERRAEVNANVANTSFGDGSVPADPAREEFDKQRADGEETHPVAPETGDPDTEAEPVTTEGGHVGDANRY